jgi:hypothetical protein
MSDQSRLNWRYFAAELLSSEKESNMTLEEIFYASQSVASIAVVGSLIYLVCRCAGPTAASGQSCNRDVRIGPVMRR